MKQVRLKPSGVLMRLVDKDMAGDLLQTLIDVVSQECDRMFPIPPSPTSIAEGLPGSGWYGLCSSDLKTSVIVTQYDPGTYARFVLQGLNRDMVFIVYRIETGRIPLDSLIPNVTLTDNSEVVAPAVELPASAALAILPTPEFQSAAESLYKMQSHQWRSASQNWSQEQLDKLRRAVEKYGRRWKLIASKFDFGEFSSQDLCAKWNELIKSSQVSGRQGKAAKATGSADLPRCKAIPQFTTREAALLSKSVSEHGQNFALISKLYDFDGRDANDLERMWRQLQNVQNECSQVGQ